MFNDLLLHEATRQQLDGFMKRPSHALLLSGLPGSGKLTVARALAAQLLSLEPEVLENYPHFLIISRSGGKQDISIDSIRQIPRALYLQIPGNAAVKRVILIEDAQLMNPEAQNALLKSLEEPGGGTIFILTATDKAELLPTVASRATSISINPVGQELAVKFFNQFPQNKVLSAWALSQGAPGLLATLLGEEDSELRSAVDQAKTFLTMDRYERLVELDRLSKNKADLSNLLEGLKRVLNALYRNAAKTNNKDRLKRFLEATKLVSQSQQDLNNSVMPRLIILKLALSLPV
ncbi:MAG TPA: AAA family ATPase [Candidatus Saccharimonadales bacterium]|nr:AAA family ATPase [Candidatus Saccharimonadales bacterium]